MTGLQTSFGALLAAPDGTWALYDASNKTLVAGNAPPSLSSGTNLTDAGIMLPVVGTAATDGRGRPCLGNGLFAPPFYYNREASYLGFAVSGWQFDPLYPHCYPVAFSGSIGDRDPDAPAPPAPVGEVRSKNFPNGLYVTSGADGCCAACSTDPSCIAYVWGDASNPGHDPPNNCWPLQSYSGTVTNFGRIFGGPPAVRKDAWWAMGLGADWYLAPAPTPHDYTRALYQLTGAPAVPPKYAMGFMATYW